MVSNVSAEQLILVSPLACALHSSEGVTFGQIQPPPKIRVVQAGAVAAYRPLSNHGIQNVPRSMLRWLGAESRWHAHQRVCREGCRRVGCGAWDTSGRHLSQASSLSRWRWGMRLEGVPTVTASGVAALACRVALSCLTSCGPHRASGGAQQASAQLKAHLEPVNVVVLLQINYESPPDGPGVGGRQLWRLCRCLRVLRWRCGGGRHHLRHDSAPCRLLRHDFVCILLDRW